MKSDCYPAPKYQPISPTCTPPPTNNDNTNLVNNIDKKKNSSQQQTYLNQQTEASSPESLHNQDKPSALLSPSSSEISSSGASFTEEDDHTLNHRSKGLLINKKINGEQTKSLPNHATDDSPLNSPTNQSQTIRNSKLNLDDQVDKLHSLRLKHLHHQRSLKEQNCDKDDQTTNGHSNGLLKENEDESNEDEINVDEINVDDDKEDHYLKRRTREIKEENRLSSEKDHHKNEKNNNESDHELDRTEEILKYKRDKELKQQKEDEEELFKQQFRNHFKKRHLINGDSSKLNNNNLDKKSDPNSNTNDDFNKEQDLAVDYSTTNKQSAPTNDNLYSIYKKFYENYFNQHSNYVTNDFENENLKNVDVRNDHLKNGGPKNEDHLKNGDTKYKYNNYIKSNDFISTNNDLNKHNLKRSNEFANFEMQKLNGNNPSALLNGAPHLSFDHHHSLATSSVLNNLDNKYFAANLANHETLATLDSLQSDHLKNMLYTNKLPESMDTIANYLNYYNGFGKQINSTSELDYRKHYDSLIANQIKNGLEQQVKSNESNSKLSNALNPTNLSINKLMPNADLNGQHLNKSLSKSLNNEKLISNGNQIANSLHNSPNSLFGQTSPPISFLNYPRPNGQAMKPNSYHQFLCNLHQQQNAKTADSLSISNLNNTAAVGGALNNSRRKLF